MPRTHYIVPMDVTRRFDPTITNSELETNDYIGTDDMERIRSRIEGVEGQWDRHARPLREVRIGSQDAPVYQSAKGKGFPIHVYLDHEHIIPFDASAGDSIERRTGIDTWTDITNEEGSGWVADYRKGKLTVYEIPGRGHLPVLRRWRDRFIRVTYRVGLGAEYGQAGQTTISETLFQGGTPGSLSVSDASRLSPGGGTMLVDGTEYVHVDGVDESNDTVSIAERGLRGTSDGERSSGSVIHYCPLNVREAISARAAVELARWENFADRLASTGDSSLDLGSKVDQWNAEWREALGAYSGNYGYK